MAANDDARFAAALRGVGAQRQNPRGCDDQAFNNLFGRGPAAAPNLLDRRSVPTVGNDDQRINDLFGGGPRGPAAAPNALDRRSVPTMVNDDRNINDLYGGGPRGRLDGRSAYQASVTDDQKLNDVLFSSAPGTPWGGRQLGLSDDTRSAARSGSVPTPSRDGWDDARVHDVFDRGAAERQRGGSQSRVTTSKSTTVAAAADDARLTRAMVTPGSAGFGGAGIFDARPAPRSVAEPPGMSWGCELGIDASRLGMQPLQAARAPSEVIKQIARQLQRSGIAPQSVFDGADTSRDGVLSKVELYQLLPRYDPSLTAGDLDSIFREFDRDGSGYIQLSEFVSALNVGVGSVPADLLLRIAQSISQSGSTPEYIFAQLDLNHDSRLSRTELQRFILHHQPNMYQSELDAVFSEFDRRNCGYVDVQAFCAALGAGLASQRSAMATLAGRLAQAGISPHRLFMRADVTGTGRSSRLDLERCLREVVPGITADEVQRVLQECDPRYTNLVDLFDFASALTKETPWCSEVVLQVARSMARIGNTPQQLFSASSLDGTATLDRSAFSQAIQRYLPAIAAMDLEALFNEFDADRNGRVDMREFTDMLDRALRSLPADTLVQITQQASLMSLSPDQLFAMFDQNHDGRLSRQEFQQGVLRVKQDLFTSDIETLFRELDRGGTGAGFVELRDFTTALQLTRFSPRADLAKRLGARIKAAGTSPQQLFMDTDSSGDAQLSELEFEQMMNRLLPGLQLMEIRKLFRDFDTDCNGSVDLREFCDVLRRYGV